MLDESEHEDGDIHAGKRCRSNPEAVPAIGKIVESDSATNRFVIIGKYRNDLKKSYYTEKTCNKVSFL